MDYEVEIITDGEGFVVNGSKSAVESFLDDQGWLPSARPLALNDLGEKLRLASDVMETLSGIAEQSTMYVKLTPESAKRLREAGGLMKTKIKGISHVMLGKTGDESLKWLQAQDGPLSLATNPAVLAGIGGLMSQAAQQSEAQELRELLVRIDEKLDDVRRAQRDSVLARMRTAASDITEAMTIREQGGDPQTLWSKVSRVSGDITNVQEEALAALGALAVKIESKDKAGQVAKVAQAIEQEVATQLAILARCFELYDQFRIVELDHVLATAPKRIDGHRRGLAEARQNRRDEVLGRTHRLMVQLDRAGEVAMANTILHPRAARQVVGALNATGEIVADFHQPLGIDTCRQELVPVAWRDAVKDRQQRSTAAREARDVTLKAGSAVGAVAIGAVFVIGAGKGGKA